MKILELRFKNLNSLYGEWVIDFTNPEYTSSGIFALTGPTGAGKSTILDALCLALYGRTPRLGKITANSNEIMSRQTGECYAEVLFESQTGSYRCHWEQRRARKSPDGKLQDQEHQIADGATGAIIESKKSLVAGVIESKTGMDFDRFTRSILLAQGGFDTFLKADVEEKSKILEQITGTQIYSDISLRVHERRRDEHQALEVLRAATKNLVVLEPEHEDRLIGELEVALQEKLGLEEQTKRSTEAVAWLIGINALKGDIEQLVQEETELKGRVEEFKPHQAVLDQALKAATLEGSYAALCAQRALQRINTQSLKTQQEKLPQLKNDEQRRAAVLLQASDGVKAHKAALETEKPLLRQVRSLDQDLATQTQAIKDNADACAHDQEDIARKKDELREAVDKRNDTAKSGEESALYLQEYAQDALLVNDFSALERQITQLLSWQRDLSESVRGYKTAAKAEDRATMAADKATSAKELAAKELSAAQETLSKEKQALEHVLDGKLLREYRAEKEALLRELNLLRHIQSLEQQRSQLEDGKACPLCGAAHHPYAEGNVPTPTQAEQDVAVLDELISQAEACGEKIDAAQEIATNATSTFHEREKAETQALNDKQTAAQKTADLAQEMAELRDKISKEKGALTDSISALHIAEEVQNQPVMLLEELRTRFNAWQRHTSNKDTVEVTLSGIDSKIKETSAVIESLEQAASKKADDLAALREKFASNQKERAELYGAKSPDDEEARLEQAIKDTEAYEASARNRHTEAQQSLRNTSERIAELEKSLEELAPELADAEQEFKNEYRTRGFDTETAFLDARIDTQTREALAQAAQKLATDSTELNTKLADRRERLERQLAQNLSDKSLDQLQQDASQKASELDTLRSEIARIQHTLNENEKAQKLLADKQAAIEAQARECARWNKLHELIGSADGKKYRNFAQGLTFELMVAHANRQLEKMTDRYLLIHDDQRPLELNVIDNYQAGEIRSTKNLSGGESFIVSLTLALGLSKMASQKVRVDSLFLDEGFGTLDEETLETALESLSGLQQDGKLIGIISHVGALKERIGTQICIAPASGGKSELVGPGCRKG